MLRRPRGDGQYLGEGCAGAAWRDRESDPERAGPGREARGLPRHGCGALLPGPQDYSRLHAGSATLTSMVLNVRAVMKDNHGPFIIGALAWKDGVKTEKAAADAVTCTY
eukprot:166671-Pyramimonas_sp.AAC.1